ncbi:CD276 antigen-like isoform X2 [Hypanus sabinus]|uniref:CD276 antigen-like isoform X2 n=1 Tax=Hypanus sabinus TaxID=79690 RepID=UPI0028C4728B|nr:CD276 antigen-like isoform X2 [Hypanus sabinus]
MRRCARHKGHQLQREAERRDRRSEREVDVTGMSRRCDRKPAMLNGQRTGGMLLVFLHLFSPVVLDSPIVARIGDDPLLICHFNRPWSRELGGIQWSLQRPDGVLLAYIYHQGSAAAQFQDKQFQGRATVNESLLGQGDASLRLQNVTVHDNGTYMCVLHTPEWKEVKEQLLIVTAPYSQPHVSCSPVGGDGAEDEGKVQLDCVSRGGFPLAHLQWVWSNGTEYRSELQNASMAQAPDGTYQLCSRLEATMSWDFDLYCVVTDSWLNQSHSSYANCPQHNTRGTESTPHSPGHCPHLNSSQLPCAEHERVGLLLFASVLLLFLLSVLLWMCCCGCTAGRDPP